MNTLKDLDLPIIMMRKPNCTIFTYRGDVIRRQYKHNVDFVPVDDRSSIRGIVMCAVLTTDQTRFAQGFIDAGVLKTHILKTRSIVGANPPKMWYMFKMKPEIVARAAVEANTTLLNHLSMSPNIVTIWKEDDHGYEINRFGNIKRSWKLDPF